MAHIWPTASRGFPRCPQVPANRRPLRRRAFRGLAKSPQVSGELIRIPLGLPEKVLYHQGLRRISGVPGAKSHIFLTQLPGALSGSAAQTPRPPQRRDSCRRSSTAPR